MKSKSLATLLSAFGAALLVSALVAASAVAEPTRPGYEDFAGCPSPKENPKIEGCLVSTITGGHFQMGSKDVPIKNPITLSGGLEEVTGKFVATSAGGMQPVKQEVPGGIIGLTGLDWLINFLKLEGLKLYAVTELAGAPGNPLFEDPFSLPIRVHLINPILGNNCYVGSFTNPIKLNLTIDTTSPPAPNKPITGKLPEFEEDPTRPGVILSNNGEFVDNSFAAPGASGCTLTLFGFIPISINGLVNSQSGLPAAAGTNETRQEFDGKLSFPFVVYP